MFTPVFVAARVLANPVSNVFQKQLALAHAAPLFVVAATHALLSIPALVVLAVQPALGARPGFAASIGIAAALAVAGNTVLVHALEAGDLSVLGPINAFKAVLSMLLGALFIGEIPTSAGLAGTLLIVSGSYFIVDRPPGSRRRAAFARFFGDPAVRLRILALVLSATEAVFLKRAILLSSPLIVFLFWSILGFALSALALAIVARPETRDGLAGFGRLWRTFVWLAATAGIMQLATLLAFGVMQVGYSLALFQLSALVSVFLGRRYFHEHHTRRRLLGAAIMVAGAALIVTLGHRS